MDTQGLTSFFSGLEATLASARKFQEANNREYAFEFNPLIHFYGVGENKLSDMLSFFLNPAERHGQGRVFAEIFIDHFKMPSELKAFSKLTVEREKQTVGLRRLDVLLTFDNRFALGIENKFGAGDQKDQTRDYCAWLEQYGAGNFTLMYLTPWGGEPTDWSMLKVERERRIADGTLLLFNHTSDSITLLDKWIAASKADKVRHFLLDFKQLLHHRLTGSIFMNNANTVADYLFENPTHRAAAFAVIESANTLYNRLLQTLKPQLVELADEIANAGEKGFQLTTFDLNVNEKDSAFAFTSERLQSLGGLEIWFEWGGYGLSGGYYGFFTKKSLAPELAAELKDVYGVDDAKSEAAWPWWIYLDYYGKFNHEAYEDIDKKIVVKRVKEKIIWLLNGLDKLQAAKF